MFPFVLCSHGRKRLDQRLTILLTDNLELTPDDYVTANSLPGIWFR